MEPNPSEKLATKIQEGLMDVPGDEPPTIEEVNDGKMTIYFPSIQTHVYVDLSTRKAESKAKKAAQAVQKIIDEPDDEPVTLDDTSNNDIPNVGPVNVLTIPPPPEPKVVGFRKATRRAAKLRLGIAGPSGSGKTMSSLLIAYGICEDWSKIGIIDTENGSGELYVGVQVNGVTIGEYNVLTLTPDYTPEKYIQALQMGEDAGLDVVIIDSLTHAWKGQGGMLAIHGKIVDNSRSGNSWSAWRMVTPMHNALVEKMLGTRLHVIATIRSKTEHVFVDGQVKKVGMSPEFRDGVEYEFTTFFDIGITHDAVASKDRSHLFPTDHYFTPSPDTGRKLKSWLEAV